MRRKSGFIRKALILMGLCILFTQIFLSTGQYIRNSEMRDFAELALVVMTVWGIITLLANRVGR